MASLSTIDIAKMEPFFHPALNLSSCSVGESRPNIGGGFEKNYQPIVEAFDCSNILFKVTDCSERYCSIAFSFHPQTHKIPIQTAYEKQFALLRFNTYCTI